MPFNAFANLNNCRRTAKAATVMLVAGLLGVLFSSQAVAQDLRGVEGRYHPLNQRTPPGLPGHWAAMLDPAATRYHQPVQIQLPSKGQVAFFSGPARKPVSQPAPAMAGVVVGHVYRLQISDMPEFPGVDLFPSIEILDRLHPPAGKIFEFPVPVQISADEIDLALKGNLITKIIYLEQPQLAVPRLQTGLEGPTAVGNDRNAIAEADRRGRPMIILRLGGRVPSRQDGDRAFFGTGAKITLPPQQSASFQRQRETNRLAAGQRPARRSSK